MITNKVEKALNAQINEELFSAYLYLSMTAWFASQNLKGFANWMRVQVQEEMFHAMKMYDVIIERGGSVALTALAAPKVSWTSPLDAFEDAFAHEKKITGLINGLVDLAIVEKDHATNTFLQWYVNEQVEEEANVEGVIQQLKLTAEAPGALFMIDKDLAARVFVMPAPAQ